MVGRNVAALFGSQLVTWSLALVLAAVVPRYLGPTGVGQLGVGVAVWSIANTVVELGTGTLLTLEFARDPDRARTLLRPVMRLRAAGEALAWVGVLAYLSIAGYDLTTSVIVALVGVQLVFSMFGDIARAALHGLQRMTVTASVDVVGKALNVVVVMGVLLVGGDVRAVAVASIVPALVACVLLWRPLGLFRTTRGLPSPPFGTVLRRSSPYFFGSAVGVIYRAVDVLIISLVASVHAVGWYTAAETLFATLLFIPGTLSTPVFPELARLHEEKSDRLYDVFAQMVRTSWLIAVPMGVGMIVVATPFAVRLLGEDFRNTGPVLAIFGVALIMMFQNILFARLAFSIDRHRLFNTLLFVAMVATLPLILVLVPWTDDRFGNGAIGGALAGVITEGFILVMAVWKLVPGLLDRPMVVRIVKVALAAAALAGAAWPLRDRFLALPVLAGILGYVATVLLLRTLDEEEVRMAQRSWARVRAALSGRSTPPPSVSAGG